MEVIKSANEQQQAMAQQQMAIDANKVSTKGEQDIRKEEVKGRLKAQQGG